MVNAVKIQQISDTKEFISNTTAAFQNLEQIEHIVQSVNSIEELGIEFVVNCLNVTEIDSNSIYYKKLTDLMVEVYGMYEVYILPEVKKVFS